MSKTDARPGTLEVKRLELAEAILTLRRAA